MNFFKNFLIFSSGNIDFLNPSNKKEEIISFLKGDPTIITGKIKNEMEKALKETIIRVKQNSINYRSEHMNPTDLNAMMQILEDRKALQALENLHISIN